MGARSLLSVVVILCGAEALRPVATMTGVAQKPAVSRRAMLAGVFSAALLSPPNFALVSPCQPKPCKRVYDDTAVALKRFGHSASFRRPALPILTPRRRINRGPSRCRSPWCRRGRRRTSRRAPTLAYRRVRAPPLLDSAMPGLAACCFCLTRQVVAVLVGACAQELQAKGNLTDKERKELKRLKSEEMCEMLGKGC